MYATGGYSMSDVQFSISIPSDEDGYVLLQCPNCGEYFKLTPHDYEDDGVLEVFCPACGLAGDSYITDDVRNLAHVIVSNYANDLIYNKLKKMEKSFGKGIVTFKAGEKPTAEYESPIRSVIDALMVTNFSCCHRTAKVKQLLKITGCYCPFCGVKNYGTE
jgi:hypothetical protein